MIAKIKGKILAKEEDKVIIEVNNFSYEVLLPRSISLKLADSNDTEVELVTYYYFSLTKSSAIPVLIGFFDDLEKDFFKVFTRVSGIGPRAALKAFDKPVSLIARAIEQGDVKFLTGLKGIGRQKARQIVAQLQGKVGRFALLKQEQSEQYEARTDKEIINQAHQILRRLQYRAKEADSMIKKALKTDKQFNTVEDFLNEIYQKHHKR
jgi:Holliday junction DNA helicase RuvA